ncbi:DUF2306 domain-containing protein [Geodermatophilus sp. SYSU D01105]
MSTPVTTLGRGRLRVVAGVLAVLIAIVLGFFAHRLVVDVPNLAAGSLPEDSFDRRYVEHPWLAYLHIVPGVLYLVGAPLQLSRRFRTRHYAVHRRLGRVLLGLALVSGVFALAFGVPFAFGGSWQAAATVVFGVWFLACLVLAFRAIRRDDVAQHRRWMIRAFAIGVAVGTIRIWIGVFQATGLLTFEGSFAVAFWLSFALHASAAEWWLRHTPALTG